MVYNYLDQVCKSQLIYLNHRLSFLLPEVVKQISDCNCSGPSHENLLKYQCAYVVFSWPDTSIAGVCVDLASNCTGRMVMIKKKSVDY